MILNVYTLPQLAVSAKLLCLLMVVICGAVPSMVRSVRLYNECSKSYVRVDMKGRVLSDDDETNHFQNLTIRSLDFDIKLSIYAEESRRFLCFNNRWKLVGMLEAKKLKLGAMCHFYEDMLENGYNRYRSVANQSHFVGFNRNGKPLRGKLAGPNSSRKKCLTFIKCQNDSEFSINNHNSKVSGGNQSSEPQPVHNQAPKINRNKSYGKQKKTTPETRIRHKNHHRNITKQPS